MTRKKDFVTSVCLVIFIAINITIIINIIIVNMISIYMKLVVTRRKGFATSALLVRLVRAWRRVTPVDCCSLG